MAYAAAHFNNDVYYEVLPRGGETVNAARYIQFLDGILKKFSHLDPGEIVLMHDNARPRIAATNV